MTKQDTHKAATQNSLPPPPPPIAPSLCNSRSRNKGSFFERAVSQKAWLPLHSLESEDGERYERMRIVFHKVLVQTRYPKRIDGLMEKHCDRDMSSCRASCETVARIFFDLLFDEELDDESADLYYRASMEWRREIAMKGE